MSTANQTVVITGASSGIGRALARVYAQSGARVGITARRRGLLDELVQEIRARGGEVAAETADVCDRGALHAAIDRLQQQLGPADLLIANAGVGYASGAEPMNVPGIEYMVKVNFLGVVYAFEAVLPDMLKRGHGHLAAVSSMAAYKGLPGSAGYCATKAAVNNYCESLRIELVDRGIAVTTICPGFIDTPMTQGNHRPMPWLMTSDKAANQILRALTRKTKVYDFPRRMRMLMWLSKWAPDRFIKRRVPITASPGPDETAT